MRLQQCRFDILNLVKRLKEKRHYLIQLPFERKKDVDYLLQKTIHEIADNANHRESGLFANLLGLFQSDRRIYG